MELITIGEAAGRCRVSTRTVQRLVAEDRFPPPIRVGGRVFFDAQGLDAWLRGQTEPNPIETIHVEG